MNEPEEFKIRLNKMKELSKKGIIPYAYSFETDRLKTPDLIKNNPDFLNLAPGKISWDQGMEDEGFIASAGRLIAVRDFKKFIFADIQGEKDKIQIYLHPSHWETKKSIGIGKEKMEIFRKYIDIGDILGVEGQIFKTKKGEITIGLKDWTLLTKSLFPLPEKYHGLKEKEKRYRMRYLDLIANPEVREIFIKRQQIIDNLRDFLNKKEFLEVDTPVLQPIYGGASARPFTTYIHSLDTNLYLRISNELYLKRLIVGGFERVYEFSKDFRNEGIDRTHYPEFTLLEGYIAYKDYYFLMNFIEEMFITLVDSLGFGDTYQDNPVSFRKPFKKIFFKETLEKKLGIPLSPENEKKIKNKALELEIEEVEQLPYHKVIEKVFDEVIAPELWNPTFVLDHPVEISPLAKKHREKKGLTERFELFICGMEIVNAFSELNDPLDQEKRFEEQMLYRKLGDEEAFVMDEDFITSLKYGMPPTAGFGIGIDRLCMILTGSYGIRDVILFPQLKTPR